MFSVGHDWLLRWRLRSGHGRRGSAHRRIRLRWRRRQWQRRIITTFPAAASKLCIESNAIQTLQAPKQSSTSSSSSATTNHHTPLLNANVRANFIDSLNCVCSCGWLFVWMYNTVVHISIYPYSRVVLLYVAIHLVFGHFGNVWNALA